MSTPPSYRVIHLLACPPSVHLSLPPAHTIGRMTTITFNAPRAAYAPLMHDRDGEDTSVRSVQLTAGHAYEVVRSFPVTTDSGWLCHGVRYEIISRRGRHLLTTVWGALETGERAAECAMGQR
jgi:hypothetical protein